LGNAWAALSEWGYKYLPDIYIWKKVLLKEDL
jgi:hypothetical protein